MVKYLVYLSRSLLSLSFFHVSIYKLFLSVYLTLQWPRSIKTLRSFVSNFTARHTSFLRRPSHFPYIPSPLFDLGAFSPFILFQVIVPLLPSLFHIAFFPTQYRSLTYPESIISIASHSLLMCFLF